jgi:hypothetical protein
MGSTFGGVAYFNSGPHRFVVRRLGRLVQGPFETALDLPYSTDRGPAEVAVVQTGRLVAATNAALWTLIDAIQARAELLTTGTLVDHHGRSWTTMRMIRFAPADRIDRGRVFSLRYRVDYLRFGS